jgi:UDP-glucose 4-epimerase
MSRVFITGVAGFLGSHLADAMLADGHEVVGIDNLLGGDRENVPHDVDFHVCDCNDFDRVRDLVSHCDIVFHCAATAYEGLSVFSPSIVTTNIVGASVSVFSAAIAAKVKRIVFCSSMARYGTGVPPFCEWQKTAPQDPYGIGKVCAEDMLHNLCKVHGTEYVIAVPHNIIGPRQKYDDPYRNVASIMMNLMLQGRAPVIYGDGSQQRCFSYIDDCLDCLKKMAFLPGLSGQTINIGPDEERVTINDLCAHIALVTEFDGAPIYMPGRPQEVKYATCSSDKARRVLDYKTKTPLWDGLTRMCEAMRRRGTKPFVYHLPLEIVTEDIPRTWLDRLF